MQLSDDTEAVIALTTRLGDSSRPSLSPTRWDSGGTWAGATEALKAGNGVAAAWLGPGEGPGNARLAELGAVPVRSADDVLPCLEVEPVAAPEQLSLTE